MVQSKFATLLMLLLASLCARGASARPMDVESIATLGNEGRTLRILCHPSNCDA